MKNITLLCALFCTITVFPQARISELGSNDSVVYTSNTPQNLAPCSEETPNDGTFEEGFNCSSASAILAANDLTVAADEIFTLTQITASIFANGGITDVEVRYYNDNAGLPGSIIGTEIDIVPSAQTVIGTNYGFDVNEIVLDVEPFEFIGQAGIPTKYWVELIVTDGDITADVFWVATSSTANGEAIAQYNGSWSKPDPTMDGVAIWSGDCDILLSTSNFSAADVDIFPNPVSDELTIRGAENIRVLTATLYNVLGENTGIPFTNGSLDTSELARGIYFLSLHTSEGAITKKIIKQ